MALSEEVAQSIDDLPEEAQSILMDFIADLKARYSNNSLEGPASEKTPLRGFSGKWIDWLYFYRRRVVR